MIRAALATAALLVAVSLLWKPVALLSLAGFAVYAYDTRPHADERSAQRAAERARAERGRPRSAEELVRDAVAGASGASLRLVGNRWPEAEVRVHNPTASAVVVEGVSCRALWFPGQRSVVEIGNRGPWKMRVEPGQTWEGKVGFYEGDLPTDRPPGGGLPGRPMEQRCRFRLSVPTPAAPPGSPGDPTPISATGYRVGAARPAPSGDRREQGGDVRLVLRLCLDGNPCPR